MMRANRSQLRVHQTHIHSHNYYTSYKHMTGKNRGEYYAGSDLLDPKNRDKIQSMSVFTFQSIQRLGGTHRVEIFSILINPLLLFIIDILSP